MTLAIGCGDVVTEIDAGGDGDGDGDGDAQTGDVCADQVTSANLEECYTRSICQQFVDCAAQFASVAECEAAFSGGGFSYFSQIIQLIVAGIDAGRINYDPVLGAECLAGIAVCTNPDACDLLFVGTTPPGGSCFNDFECGNGGDCPTSACGMQCCTGNCVYPVGRGASCANGERCESGLECVAIAGAPALCQTGEVGAPCTSDFQCDALLRCSTSQQCEPRSPEGGACQNEDSDCLEPLSCTNGMCTRPDASGDPCNFSCLGPFFCERPGMGTGVCGPLPTLGQSCATSGRCLGIDLTCSPAPSSVCVALGDVGDSCATTPCKANLRCNNLQCAALVPDGQPCTTGGDCASGICTTGTCEAFDTCY